ncbi:hypothetical protein HYC85_011083 [Camellia sinensis]|uniref:Uncharacterized protein n=1 Tax=Camellia sinensis TaxID=4442 RepID=A0A7J7HKB1_CAMSI|nr:hypothetical protein HYC85_011083 [Camellia sinensis]
MADDNWDLHAVVRGCATTSSTTTTSDSYTPSIFQALDDHRFRFFADPFEEAKTSRVEDLNDLFKPFFPKISLQKQQPPQIKPFSSPPLSIVAAATTTTTTTKATSSKPTSKAICFYSYH